MLGRAHAEQYEELGGAPPGVGDRLRPFDGHGGLELAADLGEQHLPARRGLAVEGGEAIQAGDVPVSRETDENGWIQVVAHTRTTPWAGHL